MKNDLITPEFVAKALGYNVPTTAISVPYLRQSTYEDMACSASFRAKHIDGERTPQTTYATRGTEIHEVLHRYVEYLVSAKKNADWGFFDDLLQTVGPEAAGILTGFRERYTFDYDKVFATEHKLASEELEAEGTLDAILLESPTEARIVDYKSYFQIFDVEKEPTFQSRLYPLLLLLSNEALESVTFELVFVRYGTIRKVTYTREDVPKLKQLVIAARKRQIALYQDDAQPEATPGAHCTYCPLLRTHRCPLGTMNPYDQEPGKLLQIVMQQKKALAENSLILREMVKDMGAIETEDANAGKYRAEYKLTAQRKIPLMPFLTVMADWLHASDEDLSTKVFIASTELRSLRGAKKRAILDQALVDIEVVKESTRFQIVDGEEETHEEL
jgi:CRISPR/Cas system-associated exonuclease Cas4 (RecB family)